MPFPTTTYRAAVDIGGTFTDIVLGDAGGGFHVKKILSSPDDFSRNIVRGLAELMAEIGAGPGAIEVILHGTTVATNAILEDKGAATALITTRGFRDVLELRRIRIPELYNLFYDKPTPLVPRRLVFEVAERLGPRGEVRTPLDEGEVRAALDRIAGAGVEALAVCLLHAYANPAHERRIVEIAREVLAEDVYITSSAALVPEIREYERTSTTVINAYVGPIVRRYLRALDDRLHQAGIVAPLQVMMSNGGLMGDRTAILKPAAMIESGPAAGVIGSAFVAAACGLENVITLDMGGTTAKAGIIEEGVIAKTSEYEVGAGINISSQLVKGRGHALKLPVIDLSEIGAGGGSIARVDEAGMLRVGPQSAGAAPGPVCYDAGGEEPTLADALLALGYLNPDALAAGAFPLNAPKALAALEAKVARPLGKPLVEAAYGVFLLAGVAMTRAVKAVSTYRGRDPRDFILMAFGGNGPLMAVEIARALQMTRIVVPHSPGLFSAFGLLTATATQEFVQTFFRHAGATDAGDLAAAFADLAGHARQVLAADGHPADEVAIVRRADLRYGGQSYELTVPVEPGPDGGLPVARIVDRFHDEHRLTYGHATPGEPVDFVNLRVTATVVARDRVGYGAARRDGVPARLAETRRRAYFGSEDGILDAAVIDRGGLADGARAGPIVIEEYDSTCLVPPRWRAGLDAWGNIVITSADGRG